jgi:transketolase
MRETDELQRLATEQGNGHQGTDDIDALAAKARQIRRETFDMIMSANEGHIGGSLSCVELLVALYHGGVMRFEPADPRWPGRDRFIVSKAHGTQSWYVILADLGFFAKEELAHFLEDGRLLSGHVDNRIPGVEIVAGSLGHGLGVACGLALGAHKDNEDWLVFSLIGDGESQEGSIWEAAMFACQQRLRNLVAITDRNYLGSEDFTERTAGLEPLADKWRAFGWEVRCVDGHSFPEILGALADVRLRAADRPLMIIASTVKGKGVSFLENRAASHHTLPKGDDIERARRELR